MDAFCRQYRIIEVPSVKAATKAPQPPAGCEGKPCVHIRIRESMQLKGFCTGTYWDMRRCVAVTVVGKMCGGKELREAEVWTLMLETGRLDLVSPQGEKLSASSARQLAVKLRDELKGRNKALRILELISKPSLPYKEELGVRAELISPNVDFFAALFSTRTHSLRAGIPKGISFLHY